MPVKFKSASSGKVFHFNLQWAPELFRQWNSECNNGNQKFKLTKAGVLGYYIVHVDSGRCVAANAPRATANGGTHLMVSPNFASVFVFEDAGDCAVRIRLADQPQYTVVVDGGKSGTDVVLWPQAGHESDRWYLEAFQ
ncbi:hypothetical protein PHLGIDRAFT_123552 [Phlebiopsis gigantea 11061_1 CR5-6]|uniref:Ricin B lectin domain-containing protein n=1 Tax=Phlebiopsis gigantea (strain 11061_1 CR5-6) TaxID=745531 RepID=A0A0C3S197_PHLG1|nr:hypothetical protein PHLGIDRAFT_123552 [Phlebiopsis gigantea 11061_1 CR5-6]